MIATTNPTRRILPVLLLVAAAVSGASGPPVWAAENVRFMTFNVYMSSFAPPDTLSTVLAQPNFTRFQNLAHQIQLLRPDILAVNEFDYDATGLSVALFQQNYLGIAQQTFLTDPTDPIYYPYVFQAPSNTGISSGFDFDNNGNVVTEPGTRGYGEDCFGFGEYEGQYAMLLLSRYPILTDQVRTFQEFRWRDLPNVVRPPWPGGPEPYWYSDAEWDAFRLSSKSHWDVPIEINGQVVHVLLCHPTPPVFDQIAPPETDYNGRRNADEIRFWVEYLNGAAFTDDQGRTAALPADAAVVVMGDLNADPDSDSRDGASEQITGHPRLYDPQPVGPAGDITYGGWRLDYALPSNDLDVRGAGVFNNARDPDDVWASIYPRPSDHFPVWVDVFIPAPLAADLSGDGSVDDRDLALLSAAWGAAGIDLPADLNCDGVVNEGDLGVLADQWGNQAGGR